MPELRNPRERFGHRFTVEHRRRRSSRPHERRERRDRGDEERRRPSSRPPATMLIPTTRWRRRRKNIRESGEAGPDLANAVTLGGADGAEREPPDSTRRHARPDRPGATLVGLPTGS